MKKRIIIIVGTRPNFIKVTQFKRFNIELGEPFDIKIVHTGQHYDDQMADVFFRQFALTPDYFLNIPAASANIQMAEIMIRLEPVLTHFKPDLMIVVGDVNSTFAAALTANKLGIKLAHVERGLRSNDRTMPEEINRLLTDEITYVLGGVGLFNAKIDIDNFGYDDETKLAVGGGFGIMFRAGSDASFFAEGRFVNVFPSDNSTNFIPLTFGIQFGTK